MEGERREQDMKIRLGKGEGICAFCLFMGRNDRRTNSYGCPIMECRKNPPTSSGFPKVESSDFCGEFKHRDETEESET